MELTSAFSNINCSWFKLEVLTTSVKVSISILEFRSRVKFLNTGGVTSVKTSNAILAFSVFTAVKLLPDASVTKSGLAAKYVLLTVVARLVKRCRANRSVSDRLMVIAFSSLLALPPVSTTSAVD